MMTLFRSSLLIAFLAFVSICECEENVKCGNRSQHVLESDLLNLYGLKGTKLSVVSKYDRPTWRLSQSLAGFVKALYRQIHVSLDGPAVRGHVYYETGDVFSSARAHIHVGSVPSLNITSSSSGIVKVEKGHRAKICFTSTGSPFPTVTLYKKNSPTPINTSSRIRFVHSCLEINSANQGDRGIFTLKAENCFDAASVDFRIKVIEKPRVAIDFDAVIGSHFVSLKESRIVMASGGQLVLPYNFSGVPTPTAHWSHLNSSTHSIDPAKFNESHLILHNVSQSDTGVYRVVASSSAGKAKAWFFLSVEAAVKLREPIPTRDTDSPVHSTGTPTTGKTDLSTTSMINPVDSIGTQTKTLTSVPVASTGSLTGTSPKATNTPTASVPTSQIDSTATPTVVSATVTTDHSKSSSGIIVIGITETPTKTSTNTPTGTLTEPPTGTPTDTSTGTPTDRLPETVPFSQAGVVDDNLQVDDCDDPTSNCQDKKQETGGMFLPWWGLVAISAGAVVLLVMIVVIIRCCIRSGCCCGKSDDSKKDDVMEKGDVPSGSWKNDAPVAADDPVAAQNSCGDKTEVSSKSNSLDSGIRSAAAAGEGIDDDYDHIVPKDDKRSSRESPDLDPAYEELQTPSETRTESHTLVGNYDTPRNNAPVDVSQDYDDVASDDGDSDSHQQPQSTIVDTSRKTVPQSVVDTGRKTGLKSAAAYSEVHKHDKSNTRNYADLDESALEEPLPPRPRYDSVEYSELNPIQPKARHD